MMSMASQPGSNVTLEQVWALNDDKTDVEMGGGRYSVRVVDEAGKFDINALQLPRLNLLKTILERTGDYRDSQAQSIAYALMDFIDPDLVTIGGERGDEVNLLTEWGRDEFGELLPLEWVFRPKNDSLLTLDELLAVPGITRAMMHGDPELEPADSIQRADFNLDETRRRDDALSLTDCLTVDGVGPLNVNTASPVVLQLLVEAAMQEMTPPDDVVRKILEARKEKRGSRDAQRSGIGDLGQLVQAGVPPDVLQRMAALYPLGVGSTIFTIHSRGEYQGVRHTMNVTVRVMWENYPIDPDRPETFGTRDPAADGWLKNQPNTKLDPSVRVIRIEEM
jgi:type II secretory pathway component PulK